MRQEERGGGARTTLRCDAKIKKIKRAQNAKADLKGQGRPSAKGHRPDPRLPRQPNNTAANKQEAERKGKKRKKGNNEMK